MQSLTPPSKLSCLACGGTHFVTVSTLQRSPKTGTVPSPAGYACLACQVVANVQQMVELDEVERLEKELQARQAELAARRPAATATKG